MTTDTRMARRGIHTTGLTVTVRAGAAIDSATCEPDTDGYDDPSHVGLVQLPDLDRGQQLLFHVQLDRDGATSGGTPEDVKGWAVAIYEEID